MAAFVIAHEETEFLTSPVFHAGPEQQHEAIAIFTSRESAQQYIEMAGWSADYAVGELLPIQILKWFESAHDDGVNLIVLDPDRSWHLFGDPQEVIHLDHPREAFVQLLHDELIPQADEAATAQHEDDQPKSLAQSLCQFVFSRN